jgi:hypothetical protein
VGAKPFCRMGDVQSDSLAERRDRVIARLRRIRVWLLLIVGGVAVALLPWTAYLSATLPSKHLTEHWDVAWAGLDLFEAASLVALFIAVVRRSTFVPMFAAVAGTSLLCDAWFDVTTAGGRSFHWALAQALGAELPLAALCFWLAFEVSEAIGLSAAVGSASAAAPRPTTPRDQPAVGREPARRADSEAPSGGRTSR